MDVIPSHQARLPIGTSAPALPGGWETCVRSPGPLQLLFLHLLAALFARSPHAAALWRALPLSPRLRELLAAVIHAADQDESVLRPARTRGADEILIALAHRPPPRDPCRPARKPQLRPRPSRDPPPAAPPEHENGGTGLPPTPPPHALIVTISKLNHARFTS